MITILCESCLFADIQITEIMKPIHPTSKTIIKTQHLSIWCKQTCSMKPKIITWKNHTCNYKPKSGKIDKKHTQKTLC